jgi:hypothetical protein
VIRQPYWSIPRGDLGEQSSQCGFAPEMKWRELRPPPYSGELVTIGHKPLPTFNGRIGVCSGSSLRSATALGRKRRKEQREFLRRQESPRDRNTAEIAKKCFPFVSGLG